jgi:hypothetical protein
LSVREYTNPQFEEDVKKLSVRTCAMCESNKTCDIRKQNARFISGNYDVEAHTKQKPTIPFEYDDLAQICNFFKYKSGSKAEELMRK